MYSFLFILSKYMLREYILKVKKKNNQIDKKQTNEKGHMTANNKMAPLYYVKYLGNPRNCF